MPARQTPRGCVELKGEIWYLRVPRRPRLALGRRSELRTRAAARAAADAWLARTRTEEIVPGPQLLAVEYFERFIRLQLPLMRPTSQAVYRGIIRRHIEPAVAGLKLVEVDTAWFTQFIAERAARMERKTLMNLRAVALQVLRQAVRDGFGACRISTADVRLPRRAKVARAQRYFTDDELTRILGGSSWPWRALWALMGYGGLRAGEALALTWSDVHLERRRPLLTVRQNAVRGRVGAPKTETSIADVPIIALLETELRSWQGIARLEAGGAAPKGLLFQTRNGTAYQADDVRRRTLRPLLARLGIAPAGLHAFRHSLPRILHGRGVSVAVIADIMRHASTAQTETYLHTGADDTWANLEQAGLAGAKEAA